MNIYLKTLALIARSIGGYDVVDLWTQTPGVHLLTVSRPMGDSGRLTYTFSCLDNSRLYFDRVVRLSSGRVRVMDDFLPLDSSARKSYAIQILTRIGGDAMAEADSIAATHESFEICEAEAFFPSDMRSLSAEDLADELAYF